MYSRNEDKYSQLSGFLRNRGKSSELLYHIYHPFMSQENMGTFLQMKKRHDDVFIRTDNKNGIKRKMEQNRTNTSNKNGKRQ